MDYSKISEILTDRLKLEYNPVGFYYSKNLPENSLTVGKNGNGCIAPLILQSGKGKRVVFYESHFGWQCSAYYLGYTDSIFPGIENYLSTVELPQRGCERFIKTPAQAKAFVDEMRMLPPAKDFAVYKPLADFKDDEEPEVIIFFCNPDQLSALIFLSHFSDPLDSSRVVTMFASACASVSCIPVKFSRSGEKKAVCGFHDISARSRHKQDILSISFTPELFKEIAENLDDTFLFTDNWEKIRDRITA